MVLNNKTKKALRTELELYEFKKAEQAVWKEVRGIVYGGPPLRALIHARVRTLEALRHKLFSDVPEEEEDDDKEARR